MRRKRASRRLAGELLEPRQVLNGIPVGTESGWVTSASEADEPSSSGQTGDASSDSLGVLGETQVVLGRVSPSDRMHFHEFQLVASREVHLLMFGLTADISLALYDSAGEVVGYSNLPGVNEERIDLQLPAGRYYALVIAMTDVTTDYQLALAAMSNDDSVVNSEESDQGGDSFGRATPWGAIASKRILEDAVGGADPADVYRIDVSRTQATTFQLDRLNGNVDLHLFTTSGQLVGRSDNSGSAAEALNVSLAPGSYYVLVFPLESFATKYRLSISPNASSTTIISQPRKAGDVDGGDTFGRATDVGVLDSIWRRTESVGGTDSTDVFKFQLSRAASVLFELSEMRTDLDLYVFDSNFHVVGRQYRSGATAEQIAATLPRGSYYALVIPHAASVSDYRLSIRVEASLETSEIQTEFPIPLPDVGYFGGARDWNMNDIEAPEAWAYGFTGKGVVVAVLDSGVDRTHPDLAANMWRNTDEIPGDNIDNDGNGYTDDVFGWNFVNDDRNVADFTGHGTHIAGVIAAARNDFGTTGVAYDAKLMPLRVLDVNGKGRTSSVAEAIRYALRNGADIISLSLTSDGYSGSIYNALLEARDQGVLVVAAAGNQGRAEPSYPARHSAELGNVLSVGAYDPDRRAASFSSRVGDSGAVQVDAPGVGIYSTTPDNTYGEWYGTSMAVPHVAGVAALIWSANPGLSVEQVRVALVQMANHRIVGSDSRGGLNAAASVPLAANANAGGSAIQAVGHPPAPQDLGDLAVEAAHAVVGSHSVAWQAAMRNERAFFQRNSKPGASPPGTGPLQATQGVYRPTRRHARWESTVGELTLDVKLAKADGFTPFRASSHFDALDPPSGLLEPLAVDTCLASDVARG